MSAHVLLNLFTELGGKIRCEALPGILSVFPSDVNKFSNTGARMQDYNYQLTLKSHCVSDFLHQKRQDFALRKLDVFMDVNA